MAACPLSISDEDVLKAMKKIPGYIDITPGDFKEIYMLAYDLATMRLASAMTASDVMTRQVVFVKCDTPLTETADAMADHGISGVPVVDVHEKVVGMISEKDFLAQMGNSDSRSFMWVVAQCLKNKGCVALSLKGQRAEDIMATPAITIQANTTVAEIGTIFSENNINRVPVVNPDTKLVGIVSREDIVRSTCIR
ncbi:MAG: CBS domain-containing protein [Deltaproteobacteria bacterium]|nr:CBS domain-containing protein [Deltaproteobacteria bacterium]